MVELGMLTNKEYHALENYIIERFDYKMLVGHCSREAAIRQAISDGMVDSNCETVICDPKREVRITEFVD